MAADGSGKPRGRQRTYPLPYPSGPMDTWLNELTPTAHHILDAARRLLLNDGYEALTLEAVALEAGEVPATVKRHFGSKAGLLNALFDDLDENILADLIAHCDAVAEGEQRPHVFVRGLSALATDRQLTLGMFELVPHILRDPVLRDRFAALYVMYRKLMLERSGIRERLTDISSYEGRRDAEALPALLMAVIDGMSFQMSLDPTSVDCDRVFALLDVVVGGVLDGTLTTEGGTEIAGD